ncbi:MAG: DUF4340 domain-containing protein, partial [Candidatus Obscuribacterales bacterium]|nr:DUF4340 domain-containing protein [Candidatus Obscuribacterales bacterium]
EPSKELFSNDFTKICKIIIEERDADSGKTSKTLLQKDAQGWQLPDVYGFHAAEKQINQMLTSIRDLKRGYPTSTTAGAAEHFKLSKDNFEKAVHMFDGQEKETVLYLSATPRFRSSYAKTSESNDIYNIEFSPFQINGKASDWIDRNAVDLQVATIASVDLGNFQLKKSGQKWNLQTGEKSKQLHDSVARPLLDAVTRIPINSVLGTTPEPSFGTQSPVLTCTVTLNDGKSRSYTFFKAKDKAYSVLKISDKPWYLAVDDVVVNRIKNSTAASIDKSEELEAEKTKGQNQGGAAVTKAK